MSVVNGPVCGPVVAETVLRPYLTLSAVEGVAQRSDGETSPPAEAIVRDERDPLTPQLLDELGWTDNERRFAWGDR